MMRRGAAGDQLHIRPHPPSAFPYLAQILPSSKLLSVAALGALGAGAFCCWSTGLTMQRLWAMKDHNERTKQQLLADWKVRQHP